MAATMMKANMILLVLIFFSSHVKGQDHNLTTPELCARDGYPVETHTVTTADGYILTMHRIPGSPGSPPAPGKPVVFLQHGLLASSSIWLINAPGKRLGYLLADAGYDVWMGNARGNIYSRSHVKYNPGGDFAYWEFSWHQMGIYDLPVVIDHILEQTGKAQLSYIGHSMGTTMFFVLTSLMPEYNEKINLMIGLAPVAYMQYMGSPLRILAPVAIPGPVTDLLALLSTQGKGEYSPNGSQLQKFKEFACQNWVGNVTAWAFCALPLFVEYGFDPWQVDITLTADSVGHFPQGNSVYAVLHHAQGVQNGGRFRQFDYGLVKNLLVYGSASPPDYPLSKITAPIALINGWNDLLADPVDVENLAKVLKNKVLQHQVTWPYWNHGDFVTAIDVNYYLHPIIFNLLSAYN